jgi:hypothetical protein
MKYFVNQTLEIRITVTFDDDTLKLADAESVEVGCITPTGAETKWTGTASGEAIVYGIPAGELTNKGRYRFWGIVTFAGDPANVYYTEAAEIELFNQGDL